MTCVEARGLRKTFGAHVALDGIDLAIGEGRIVGIIGPNGAGKTTALNAILGLIPFEGDLRVLGHDPWTEREVLMREVAFIADVAILPRWIRVSQLLDFVAGVHPKFSRARAEEFLARTSIPMSSRVRQLSKGMVAQLHLAIVMSIDASLLVFDEPTLGLDPMTRERFYAMLLEDYFDRPRTIILSTHQIEEIENVLTDVIFIDRGRIALRSSIEEIEQRYVEVMVAPGKLDEAQSLNPLRSREVFGRSVLLFDGVSRDRLEQLGDTRTPALTELFSTVMHRNGHDSSSGGD